MCSTDSRLVLFVKSYHTGLYKITQLCSVPSIGESVACNCTEKLTL